MVTMLRNVLLVGIVGVVLLALSGCTEPPYMTILYENASGLTAGDEVIYKGTVIGRVTEVALKPRPSGNGGMFHVGVAINEDHRTMLSHQMGYLIESERLLSEKKQISVSDAPPGIARRPVQQGDLVMGTKSFWQRATDTMAGLVRDFGLTMDEAGEALTDWLERADRALNGADRSMVDDLLRQLEDFTEDAAEAEEELLEEIEAYLKSL